MEFKGQFIFSKKLTSSHISHQLNMPEDSIQSFLKVAEGERGAVIQAMDTSGVIRTFRYLTRNEGQYSKPYLSMGWKDFVQKTGLREGDTISFYKLLNPEGEVRFMIKAEREYQNDPAEGDVGFLIKPLKLMGAEIGTTWRVIDQLSPPTE